MAQDTGVKQGIYNEDTSPAWEFCLGKTTCHINKCNTMLQQKQLCKNAEELNCLHPERQSKYSISSNKRQVFKEEHI